MGNETILIIGGSSGIGFHLAMPAAKKGRRLSLRAEKWGPHGWRFGRGRPGGQISPR
jgi:NAD(P)-dependent dehydrogenase (short-subunit alcohol dehydrogenase family)